MRDKQGFKTRVKDVIIKAAQEYQNYFLNYDYLICSEAFFKQDYYIIKGNETNFKHLTGVIVDNCSPKSFFEKSLNGTLTENDFEIRKNEQDAFTKGSIRRKISVIQDAMQIFKGITYVEEDFQKNNILCSFATENGASTLGFTLTGIVTRPLTLLKGNQLDINKSKKIELVLRKKREEELFNDIIIGDKDILNKYKQSICGLMTDELLK